MDDVERDAQAFGWDCGWNRTTSDRYRQYGHLQRAYSRGWIIGRQDRERVDTYAAAMLRGAVFPPIIVDRPGGRLMDGYHRIAACIQAGIETIDVVYAYQNAERFEDCLTVCDSRGVWSRES